MRLRHVQQDMFRFIDRPTRPSQTKVGVMDTRPIRSHQHHTDVRRKILVQRVSPPAKSRVLGQCGQFKVGDRLGSGFGVKNGFWQKHTLTGHHLSFGTVERNIAHAHARRVQPLSPMNLRQIGHRGGDHTEGRAKEYPFALYHAGLVEGLSLRRRAAPIRQSTANMYVKKPNHSWTNIPAFSLIAFHARIIATSLITLQRTTSGTVMATIAALFQASLNASTE